ncbi:IFN protein, partial [Centropus unirufus]|nr:IFN protein [Centropus unirufus]
APTMPHTHTPRLLLLLTALHATLACQLLSSLPDHGLHLLHTMAPSSAHLCHHQHQHPSFFPDALRHNNRPHPPQHTAFCILDNLLHTLSSQRVPQHWDNHARQLLLNSLHQHQHRLQQCLTHSATLPPRSCNHMLSVNRYFRTIQNFLNDHNHSLCAWEHVRLEAHLCLQNLHNLTRTTH